MSTFDAVLIGALGMAAMLFVLVAAVWAVWKIFPMFSRIEESCKALDKSLARSLKVLVAIGEELAYVRSLAPPPVTPNFGSDPENPQAGTAQEAPKPPAPFPAPIFDRFQVVPDATIEDTDTGLLKQTDADLVEMEKLEALRQTGMQVEDSDAEHDAIEVDGE